VNGRELADPWLRIAASLIDFIILFILAIPFGLAGAFSAGFSGGTADINVGLIIVGSIVGAAYVVLMNTFLSATVGKLILGLRIVKNDGTEPLGIPVGPIRSGTALVSILGAIPFLGVLIQVVVGIVGLVSLVFLFTDDEHRTVMDKAANTYVVKKK